MLARNDEIAEEIVCRLGRSISEPLVLDYVKSRIEELRSFTETVNTEPLPSEAKETIKQIATRAQTLASCIERLSPNWRFVLSWSFYERNYERDPNGALVSLIGGRPSHLTAETKMGEFISALKRIPHDLGQMQDSPHDFFLGPKARCALVAREIILALAPTAPLTKGDKSEYYLITSWLWQAVSGEEDKSMKRACDKCINFFKAIDDDIAAHQPKR